MMYRNSIERSFKKSYHNGGKGSFFGSWFIVHGKFGDHEKIISEQAGMVHIIVIYIAWWIFK